MNAILSTERILQAREQLMRPLGQAEGLPGCFYGEEFFALEQKRLFPRSWCAVTVGARIPNAGDMAPIDLAGWSVLVVRGKDGEIRAFHNICRHRGIRLVSEPASRPVIVCAWHCWSYSLKGELIATPDIGGDGVNVADGIDRSTLGLKEIRVGQWLDLIFVNIDGTAPPFEDYIAPAKALLETYDLAPLVHAMQVNEGYKGNWKLGMEGGLEHYHLTFAHPQLKGVVHRNAAPCFAQGSLTGSSTDVRGPAKADGQAWGSILPPLTTLDGEPLPTLFTLNLFPTGTVLVSADQLMLGALLPEGPLATRFELHVYLQPEAATAPDAEQTRQQKLAQWYEVIPQDQPFVEAAQAASFSRDEAGVAVRFSPYWEEGVRGFQRLVLDAVLAA
jgi:choline monooxygenase